MELRHHNYTLDGSDLPLFVGDRWYGQDILRDFFSNKEYAGRIQEDLLGLYQKYDSNIVINGLTVTQGAGHTVSWTAGRVKVTHTLKTPTNWTALPPAMTSHTIPVNIDIPAVSNQAITSATTDGVTVNYAKVEYLETGTSSRTRAKKAGSYNSEVSESYTFTCDSTPPTASEVAIATFTTNGAAITFTNDEPRWNKVKAVTTTYTAKIYDKYISGSGTFTITLPTIATAKGQLLYIDNIGAGILTIDGDGAETIEGVTDINLSTDQKKLILYCNGTEWKILNNIGVASIPITIDSDTTIASGDNSTLFIMDCNTASQYGLLTLKAPEVGSATSIIRRVEHSDNRGLCIVDANQDGSAQVFDWFGEDIQFIHLYHSGDFVEFYWNTVKSKWSIYNHRIAMKTDFVAGSDYSSSSPGAGVTYDDGSGTSTKSVDWTGMVVTEATSGITAIVSEDTGGSGKAGILYFYDFDGTPRYFTNNRVLTASNGETIDVNEASGTSKDINYAVYHGFGVNVITNIVTYHVPLAIGTATYAGSMQIANNVGDVDNGANVHGQTIHFTNSNQFQNYTSASTGFQHVTAAYGYSQGINTYYAYVITF